MKWRIQKQSESPFSPYSYYWGYPGYNVSSGAGDALGILGDRGPWALSLGVNTCLWTLILFPPAHS
jgi:hypothetical protein